MIATTWPIDSTRKPDVVSVTPHNSTTQARTWSADAEPIGTIVGVSIARSVSRRLGYEIGGLVACISALTATSACGQNSGDTVKRLHAEVVTTVDPTAAVLTIDESGLRITASRVLWIREELEADAPQFVEIAASEINDQLRQFYGPEWMAGMARCRPVGVTAQKLLDLPDVRRETYEPFRVSQATTIFVDGFIAMDLRRVRRAARSGTDIYCDFDEPGSYDYIDKHGTATEVPGAEIANVSLSFLQWESFLNEAARRVEPALTTEFAKVWDSPLNLELVRSGRNTPEDNSALTLGYSVLLPGDLLCWKRRTGLFGGRDRKGWRALLPAPGSTRFEAAAISYGDSLAAELPTLKESDELTIALGRAYIETSSLKRKERQWPEVLGVFKIPRARTLINPSTYVLLTSGKLPGSPRFVLGLRSRQ